MEKEETIKKQWATPCLADMDVDNTSKDVDTKEAGSTFAPSPS